eukprot:19328-Heterococcus_DN1.PRE.1
MEAKSSYSPRQSGDKNHQDDGEEDDDAVIAMISTAESKREDWAPNTGFSLNLAHAARRQDDASNTTVQDADSAISQQETQVLVVFELPDGSRSEQQFKLGQTVEVLKSFVESEFGIAMQSQELYLDSTQRMMDPLSLLDYPSINPKEDVYILVEGDMGDEAKK